MTLKKWMQENDFSLALSSGFFGFYAHCGFAKALYEANCIPKEVAGASAGAIVAGALASDLHPQKIQDIILQFKKADFWDPAFGLGLLRGQMLEEILAKHFIQDFSQAVMPLHISTFDIFRFKTVVTREGSVSKAIRASSAVPLMFQPTRIGKRHYWDGGIRDKAAIAGLDSAKPILCHYLRSPGFLNDLEFKAVKKKSGPQFQLVMLEGLSTCGPDLMHRGPELIEQAYEKTRQKLEQNIF